MDMKSIGRISSLTIDLNEITSGEVADHLPQFSDVLEKILEQVLNHVDDRSATVQIMSREDMIEEAVLHGEEPNTAAGLLYIEITEIFPCKK